MKVAADVLVEPLDVDPKLLHKVLAKKHECLSGLRLQALGDISILAENHLGFFCSRRCPGQLILGTYDLARSLRDSGRAVISGFHSPMERECLALLLRGTQPIIVCPARSLEKFRSPPEWGPALEAGRLLVLSPFEAEPRATTALAVKRNLLVAALADEIFIAHAQRGSKTEAFARTVVSWGKPLLTLEDDDNEVLVELGAKPIRVSPK